jgi:hypothetical protein
MISIPPDCKKKERLADLVGLAAELIGGTSPSKSLTSKLLKFHLDAEVQR